MSKSTARRVGFDYCPKDPTGCKLRRFWTAVLKTTGFWAVSLGKEGEQLANHPAGLGQDDYSEVVGPTGLGPMSQLGPSGDLHLKNLETLLGSVRASMKKEDNPFLHRVEGRILDLIKKRETELIAA